ncbi:MAG: ABC transporter ATP-binding protein [Lachnospiraceae bacterium]|nr:ABC transporter ATP-binding protein [Lachnospiraceae bacterium]
MKKKRYYLLKYWYLYLPAVLGLLISEVLDMVSPMVTKGIVDDVIIGGQTELLVKLLLLLVAVGVGRSVFGYLKEYTFDRTSFGIAGEIRRTLFRHIQTLSVGYFDDTNTGEIMARLKDDVDKIQAAFGYIGMLAIQMVVHTIMILYCMARISWKLTLLPMVALPICGLLAVIMERRLDSVYDDISEENAQMNTVAEENLSGVRIVKAFAREKFEIKKFLGHNRKYYELNMKLSKVWIKYNPMFQLIGRALTIFALLWGGILVIDEELTLGELAAFVEYTMNAVWPMEMLGWLSNELASAFASEKKLQKIFNEKAKVTDPTEDTAPDTVRGDIAFKKVSLNLDNKEILKDISFTLPAGKTLGIMGDTGSGKTTLINMLMRFYDPDSGEVQIDGIDIRKIPLAKVRGNISTVMQDVFLFSDTIEENVKMGERSISEERIDTALRLSCADEFVNKLDDKTDTVIGERGVGLSGGQKQRISMARAIAKKRPILILDDSTSALDMETEKQVQRNLKELGQITKIIIAHRISSVAGADEIIVLDKGKIIERGTHEELLAKKGYYFKTYELQIGSVMEEVV